jgi:serine/threonine-protein kinase
VLPDFDPTVERAILRCLESDPAKRPSSALQVLGSLPGGDPLAAALAAGETPSPEMVAAAGGEGAASPRRAWTLLGGTLLLVAAIVAIAPYSTDLGLSHPPKAPAVLTDRARSIAAAAGYAAEPVDEAVWLARDYDPMRYLARLEPSPQWRAHFAPWGPPLLLRYRQGPQALVPRSPGGGVTDNDPPFVVPGMVSLDLTMGDRLRSFTAVPPVYDSMLAATAADSAATRDADWDAFFAAAGLDRAAFREVPPRWVPAVPFDRRSE